MYRTAVRGGDAAAPRSTPSCAAGRGWHQLPPGRCVPAAWPAATAAAAAGLLRTPRRLHRRLNVPPTSATSGRSALTPSTSATPIIIASTADPVMGKAAHHRRRGAALPIRLAVRVAASPSHQSEPVTGTVADRRGGDGGSSAQAGGGAGGGGGGGGGEGSLAGHIASSAVGAAAGTTAVLAALGRSAVAALGYFSGGVAVVAGALGGALVGDLLLGRARAEDVETDADVERGAEEAAERVIQKLRAAKARTPGGSLGQAYRARRLLLGAPHNPAAAAAAASREQRPRD